MTFHVTRDRRHPRAIRLTETGECSLCYGSGWIPGVAGDGPLDEMPCPECSAGAVQHTYTAACDGHHAPGAGPCPAATIPDRPAED